MQKDPSEFFTKVLRLKGYELKPNIEIEENKFRCPHCGNFVLLGKAEKHRLVHEKIDKRRKNV